MKSFLEIDTLVGIGKQALIMHLTKLFMHKMVQSNISHFILMKKFYNWVIEKAATPGALWVLAALSFAESSLSPLPPDPLLIPMILANRKKAWFLAGVCTATSVAGGILGYTIGYYFFEAVGWKILEMYDLVSAFYKLKEWFHAWGFWIILVKGLTPIPYKVVTITSGATDLNFSTFLLASILSRGGRFYLEALLFWKYGEKMNAMLKKHSTLLTIGLIVLLVLGFVVIKYIV